MKLVVTMRFVLFMIVSLAGNATLAGEYTPPGLYDVEYYQLPNKMRVLLKERHHAKSVSFSVVVNVGTADYPCGRRETPHFLEHLLFTGTSSHEESELDDLIEEHGGWWNASTGKEETSYYLNIFSNYADLGLETLHEIITDSLITQGNVDKSRDIIHRESGGKPSFFKRWSNDLDLGKTGVQFALYKLLQGTPYTCRGLETADDISRADILEAYHRFYVPNNMTLIVVGDFDSVEMKNNIEATFGNMKVGEPHQRQVISAEPNTNPLTVSSTLSPLVDNEALVGVAYGSGGSHSPDFYPRLFIEEYLSDRLYKKLRIEEGLSYSASVYTVNYSNTGVWFAGADSELDDIDEVVNLIQHEINQLILQPISEKQLQSVKNKLLLSIVQGYESNADVADFYEASLHELEKYGALVREEEKINALSAEDIHRVAIQIFEESSPVVFYDKPTITYTQLAAVIGIFMLSVGYMVVRRIRRPQAGRSNYPCN
jgi:predicted Zn-dependent peptidase